jgi:hypothetical protein
MITGATSKYEQNELYRRIREGGSNEQKELKVSQIMYIAQPALTGFLRCAM